MRLFDTHCHLNFESFKTDILQVINSAKKAGVGYFAVVGTDIQTSKKAIEIALKFENIWATVGIHPHHLFETHRSNTKSQSLKSLISQIEVLLKEPKVVAIGEIGLDRYQYQKTKYSDYQVSEDFINLQKIVFIEQLRLAKKNKKAVVIHNRQAKKDLLEILNKNQSLITKGRMVFHCCEPEKDLLEFARKDKIFIGVDGDVFYNQAKQEFIKKIPLELLVLETDSPFLSPTKKFPNEPKNLILIAEFVSKILKLPLSQLIKITTKNAKRLYGI